MNFKNFIESFPAYAKKMVRPQGKPTNLSFDDTLDYNARIKKARTIEEKIRTTLAAEVGMVIKTSSANQDKNEGIDGWIVSKDGGKTPCAHIPVQIKIRKNSSGNDILWETIKPWTQFVNSNFEELGDKAFSGKDMKCKATYLISIGNNGSTVRIRKVDEVKTAAKELAQELVKQYRATGQNYAKSNMGEARITVDPSRQANFSQFLTTQKVNCFIYPGALSWKLDLNLKNPIIM